MSRFQLLTQYSPWFYLLCLLVGAAYALALYLRVRNPWPRWLDRVLAALRFVLVSLLCFLLLGPFVRRVRNQIEPPTLVFAVDNSRSVALGTDSAALREAVAQLRMAAEVVGGGEVRVEVRTLGGPTESWGDVDFDGPTTDLNDLLRRVGDDYENRNLGGVVLASDGIYNQGTSPVYRDWTFPVWAVGLGDTTVQRDLKLRAVYYNKIAYRGNRFPIVAEVQNAGFGGQTVRVRLQRRGQTLAEERLTFGPEGGLQQVEFLTAGTEAGTQRFEVVVEPLGGEFTTANNQRSAFVDVIDAREKILVVARAPHPDLKAIRAALAEEENYELIFHVPGVNDLSDADGPYDLVILHQLPATRLSTLLPQVLKNNPPVWYIVGEQTDLAEFNRNNGVLTLAPRGRQHDEVTGAPAGAFNRFRLGSELPGLLPRLPPLTVRFGDWTPAAGTETILYQQVGRVVTDKPLLAYNPTGPQKRAVLAGDGLWRWRLQEYELTGKHEATDELVRKLVQLLSAKEDKRKFRVTPVNDEFLESERVVFETEIYNDIYEPVYNQEVELNVTDEAGETRRYAFVNSESNARFVVGSLPQGVYSYRAVTNLNGTRATSAGQFTVRHLELEALNVTADHDLLRRVAQRSGGRFFTPAQLADLPAFLAENQPKSVIRSREDVTELIDLRWLFFVLLALVSVEWFVRKYKGAY
ncbi:MAG: VWA domain-containing protein [Catalinimonas sp.]